MEKEVIIGKKAPAAIGPYSPALKVGNLIFESGQLAIDPKTGEMIEGNIEAKTRMVLENLKAVLEPYSIGIEKVVKTTIFLKDMNNFVWVGLIKFTANILRKNFRHAAVWKYPVFPRMQR